jgi:hypothetical protein
MKKRTKSSITLPPGELRLVTTLQARLRIGTKVEVVRRGLQLLKETTDRDALREGFRLASLATRPAMADELRELAPHDLDGLEG